MDWGTQLVGPGAFLVISVSLLLSLLKIRRQEIFDMQKRMRAVEHDNKVCTIIQARLVNVLYNNGLTIPEGTFVVHLEEDAA